MQEQRPATIVLANEGETYDAVGDRYRFLANREVTDGKYALWEAIVPPGGGPPPHLHRREEEGFYVIEGEVAVYVDGRRVLATPGCFVNMPVGSTHWFRNESSANAKMLVLVAPGGLEAMFRRSGTAVHDTLAPIAPVTDEEKHRLVEIVPDYGVELKLGK